MFDVRPVDGAGRVDVSRTENLSPAINLRGRHRQPVVRPVQTVAPVADIAPARPAPPVPPVAAPAYSKETIVRELESTLHAQADPKGMLTRFGAAVADAVSSGKPRYRPVLSRKSSDLDWRPIIAEIYRPMHRTEEAREPALQARVSRHTVRSEPRTVALGKQDPLQAAAIENWYGVQSVPARPAPARPAVPVASDFSPTTSRKALWSVIGLLVIGLMFGFVLKGKVVHQGSAAVQNLENAKTNLEQFNFGAASEDFLLAYEEFSKAAESMSVFGANVGGVLGELPGAGKLKSASNLIEAGKLIAQAGQAMADIVKVVSRTGVVLNPNSNSRVLTAEILTPLKRALQLSDTNLALAGSFLAEVDPNVIPEEKREMFIQFSDKLPEFQKLIHEGASYTAFFEQLMGTGSPRTYLILFQNSSELRPTGGFPGTYGLFTLQDGRVKSFVADDVYDIDGQLKELLVPPRPLQHITPNWAMRDSAWFIDFPVSARKVMDFYKKETGSEVEGVITINPQIMADLLSVIGPIPMPEYGLTLTGENFLATVQNEVEYGENKEINQPKKIIVDLAPLFIKKLYSAPRDKWLEIFNVFASSMEEKNLLMYFKDPKLQQFASANGFDGQVASVPGDYLMVTFSNIKGSKADAVTDTSLELNSDFSKEGVTHKLTVTRNHKGGKSQYGFYNKQSPAYVRILVPKGSELIGISGNSNPGYRPLLNYERSDYGRDPELSALESSGRTDGRGLTTYQESGKTGFGFWMVVDPGEIKTVELEYRIPAELARKDYELFVQKQPGLELKSFDFSVSLPDGSVIQDAMPVLTGSRGRYGFSVPLKKDLPIRVKLK